MKKSLIILTSLIWFGPIAIAADSCGELYEKHLKTDMKLSYQDFDQTETKGFRALAGNCPKEAADLILAYIKTNDAKEGLLIWHVAQLRATAGQTNEAISYAEKSLRSDKQDMASKFRWNDYVKATIGFLKKDKAMLKKHRDAVAKDKEKAFGNAINLRMLDALLGNFEKSYALAAKEVVPLTKEEIKKIQKN